MPDTGGFDIFFDLRLNKRPNIRDSGDLRRHRAHPDVTVMGMIISSRHIAGIPRTVHGSKRNGSIIYKITHNSTAWFRPNLNWIEY